MRGRAMKVTENGRAISKANAMNTSFAHFASCQIEDDLKVNCGHAGVTQPDCVARGCCYRPSKTPGIPWCFVAKEKMDPQCTVPRQDKINCGFRGIPQDQCEARGCCYADAGAQRIPWCFQKPDSGLPQPSRASAAECVVPGKEKVECGFAGVTESQCLRKGCCYHHTETPGEPFCYDKWIIVTGQEAKEAEECGAKEADRIECGFKGIPSDQCRNRGCCYERTGHEGVPFCFQKTTRSFRLGDRVVAEECAVPDAERFDCGFANIQPEQCRAKGCCYAPAETTGAPYCFWKEPTEAGSPLGAQTEAERLQSWVLVSPRCRQHRLWLVSFLQLLAWRYASAHAWSSRDNLTAMVMESRKPGVRAWMSRTSSIVPSGTTSMELEHDDVADLQSLGAGAPDQGDLRDRQRVAPLRLRGQAAGAGGRGREARPGRGARQREALLLRRAQEVRLRR
eukprot:CAMPEP_0113823606 /NCGR_PEP_ID=MMETSP0328-20130328/2826_1 /TAXON_ID=39455 /ORGANISM="Alexandrium minutum" /LENGTH=451 /DNA_ID=CAMNT_0000791545 /DNA_START=111 /DNA_END=1465 /DNA_ORIENTATION=- /assembly_acc=CAM_ASM_000350